MIRTLLLRLLLLPPALFLVNFIGYAYAHFALPIRAARLPFFPRNIEQPPLFIVYGNYLSGFFEGNFGEMPGGQPLLEAMGQYAFNSLGLLLLAMVIAVVLGMLLGMAAVFFNPPRVAGWLEVISSIGLAMPSFYIGSLLVVALVIYLINTPPEVQSPFAMRGIGWTARHLTLPVIALSIRPMVQIAKVTATLIADELSKQYILTARSVGNTLFRIRWKHALSNVLAQVVLTITASLRLTMGELIVVEWLFEWPGLGRLLAQTLVPPQLSSGPTSTLFLNPVVMGGILATIALIFLLSDLVATLITRRADPRLTMDAHRG